MNKMIKTSLVALSLVAGASFGYAADNNRDGTGPGMNDHGGMDNRTDMLQRQGIDPNSTGSIQECETQSYDALGNCVVDPDVDMR